MTYPRQLRLHQPATPTITSPRRLRRHQPTQRLTFRQPHVFLRRRVFFTQITYGVSLNRERGREANETDVSVIGVMTSLWCALLPTQASEVAAQICEVQLFCCSKFKRAWEVHRICNF
ncbi:hypothetical protein YC2023_090224 [Brassica napus]